MADIQRPSTNIKDFVNHQTRTSYSEALQRWRRLVLGVWCFSVAWSMGVGVPVAAQPAFVGKASNFTLTEYNDPPNETHLKSRINGVEAQPQAGGRYLITQLRLELFDENGVQQMIIEAPECLYDGVKRTAASAGPLHMESGDGKMSIDGVGFLWRQDAATLTISNQVHTTIRDVKRSPDQP